jgi:hypothetical protein
MLNLNGCAIRNIHPNVVTIRQGLAFDASGDAVDLDENLINAEVTRLQAEFDSKEYQRKRAAEYPLIADQLDDIFHNGLDGWKASVQSVKDRYPKP